jgi:hypothetical protein
MHDRDAHFRWSSMGPASLSDLSLHALRAGFVEATSGLKVWLTQNGVRFRTAQERGIVGQAKRALHLANAKRVGASQKAVNFWFGG